MGINQGQMEAEGRWRLWTGRNRVFWQQSEAGTFHFEILTCVSPIAPCSGAVDPHPVGRVPAASAGAGI